jgi:hypothetical protein
MYIIPPYTGELSFGTWTPKHTGEKAEHSSTELTLSSLVLFYSEGNEN